MKVSVCIIAYNEEKTLKSLFSDIVHQDYPHEKMEIILVDSMSTDHTKKIMEEFSNQQNGFERVKVLSNPKKNQAAGWNVAIRNSIGDIIIRIDAHTKIPKEFVKKNVNCISSGEDVSGGPRPNIAEDNNIWKQTLLLAEKSMFGSSIATYRRSHHKTYVKSVFHGAYRREVFEKVGLFNENLGRTEDNEMHYRITKAGYRICYTPDIVSYQHTRNTWHGMIKQKYGNGYWIGLTVGICIKCFSVYHFIPFCFVLALIIGGILAVGGIGWPLVTLVILYSLVNILMSVASIVNEKKKHLSYLLLPFIFVSLHISYGIGTIIGLLKMPFWRKKLKTSENFWESLEK